MLTGWTLFWVYIGALVAPIFTIGCVLVGLGNTTLGIILIVLGVADFIGDWLKK